MKPKLDHYMLLEPHARSQVLQLADALLASLKPKELRLYCPDDYPDEVGDEHRTCVWAILVDTLAAFDAWELFEAWDNYVAKRADGGPFAATILEQSRLVDGAILLDEQYSELTEDNLVALGLLTAVGDEPN